MKPILPLAALSLVLCASAWAGGTSRAGAAPSARPAAPATLSPAHTTGQPGANCEDLGNQPGRAMNAPGSAFNPSGTAGGVYAGEQPQNSRNTASVSQYDVACARPRR